MNYAEGDCENCLHKHVCSVCAKSRVVVCCGNYINQNVLSVIEDIKTEPILLDTWEIKDKKAELWLAKGRLQIRAFGTVHNSVTLGEMIDRKVNEVKHDKG